MSEINRLATKMKKAGVPLHLVEKLRKLSDPDPVYITETVAIFRDDHQEVIDKLKRELVEEKLKPCHEDHQEVIDRLKRELAEATKLRSEVKRLQLSLEEQQHALADLEVTAERNSSLGFETVIGCLSILAGCDCCDMETLKECLDLCQAIGNGAYRLRMFDVEIVISNQVYHALSMFSDTPLSVDPQERWLRVSKAARGAIERFRESQQIQNPS